MDNLDLKLERLRKLWLLAKSKGNVVWMKQIENDANLLKEKKSDGDKEKTTEIMTTHEIEAIING